MGSVAVFRRLDRDARVGIDRREQRDNGRGSVTKNVLIERDAAHPERAVHRTLGEWAWISRKD